MNCHSKVVFTIPGPAQAKQRPRINRNTGRVYTPGATSKYEDEKWLDYHRAKDEGTGKETG